MTAEPRCWGGGGVSHPSQLTTGLVIKSVTTSPTLAGERILFILWYVLGKMCFSYRKTPCTCLFLFSFGVGCVCVASFALPGFVFCSMLPFSSSGFVFCSSSSSGSASFRSFFFFCLFGGFLWVVCSYSGFDGCSCGSCCCSCSSGSSFTPFFVPSRCPSPLWVWVWLLRCQPLCPLPPLPLRWAPLPLSMDSPPLLALRHGSLRGFRLLRVLMLLRRRCSPLLLRIPSGFQNSEAPPPPLVLDSVLAEIRHMYTYLVDLFPRAAGSPIALPPPRALFEEFLSSASARQQPVFLSWFEKVCTALSDADSHLASLLVGSCAESSLLPPRSIQYVVRGEHALGSVVPGNPSLLPMFRRPLRPSFQLGLTVREAAVLESSCCSLSEALSHAMWLLSGLLGFVRLQGFARADAALFNTLVTSLSNCLAH